MADIVTIGRTHYYTVRKGAQQFRVAEGKRLNDPDCAWMVLKDNESGKPYYVNHAGTRRWHLPDIYQTDEEREREQEELRFRRERRLQQEREGGAAGADDPSAAAAAGADSAPVVVDHAARDQAALKLKPNREWEDIEKRRQAFKLAKSTLAPLAAQGQIPDDLFPTIVSTICYEFFARRTAFGPTEKKELAADVVKYANERVEEIQLREAYRKMNSELLEKIKRIDAERKVANTRVVELLDEEERMKSEIFNLRGHKQDTLLSSFKRLTRAGLIKTYWQRWKTFRGVLEAQLHVRARERRAIEMSDKISELEKENGQLKQFVLQLQERVQRSEGRDVMALMLKQSGTHIAGRYFANWRRFALESVKEKQYSMARDQIMNCPNCELREVDNRRVRVRLDEAYRIYRESQTALANSTLEREKLQIRITELEEALTIATAMAKSATASAEAMSSKTNHADQELLRATMKQQGLVNEIERLQFEVMSLSDFSRGGGGMMSGAAAAGVGGGGWGEAATPRDIGNFFEAESQHGAQRLRDKITGRSGAKAKIAAEAENLQASVVLTGATVLKAAQGSPPRGYVHRETAAAIAPMIRPLPPPPIEFNGPMSRSHMPGPPSEAPPESLLYRQDLDSSSSSSSDEANDDDVPPPPPPEEDKCDRCGFRKRLTPFCPKDGSRHAFEALDPVSVHDLIRQIEPDRSDLAFTMQHRRAAKERETQALPAGLPPPEYRPAAGFGSVSGERSGTIGRAAQSSAITSSASYAQNLRSSVNLDPRAYDVRKTAQLHNTVMGPLEGDTHDMRAVAEHVRNTKMAIDRRTQEFVRQGRPVELPPTHVPLDEFRARSAATSLVTVLDSGIGVKTARAAEQAHRAAKPSWKDVFDYSDFDSTTLGIGPSTGAAFGVSKSAELGNRHVVVPAQRTKVLQAATPNFSVQTSYT